jgi:hypothetical protein
VVVAAGFVVAAVAAVAAVAESGRVVLIARFLGLPLMFFYVVALIALVALILIALIVLIVLDVLAVFHLPHNLNIANIQTYLSPNKMSR